MVCAHNAKSSSRGIRIVSAAMDSATSWGCDGYRRGYNLSCDDRVSFHERDGWRERTHGMRRPSAPRWNRSIPFARRYGVDPEALELALDGRNNIVGQRTRCSPPDG